MAPAKLPPCRVCTKKDSGKYRCPIDHVDYCSVACFKQHKEKGCRSEATYQPPPLSLLPSTKDEEQDDLESRPTKRLKDLTWPAEPNPMLWDDPLARDDLKPLRPFELEAIALDPEIRTFLSSPTLRTTLSRLTSLPRHAREPSLRTLLDLAPEPAPTTYRPDPSRKFATGVQTKSEVRASEQFQARNHHAGASYGSGRGGSRGRGRGGHHSGGGGDRAGYGPRPMKLLESTEEERKEVARFAAVVRKVLADARQVHG
ncbi:hypothetical protein JCM10212_001208 [Sporobolomyces blumeae]